MKITAYHGSNMRFATFDDRLARIVNDFYGGGIAYFTESMDVAKSYASNMFRKYGGDRYVYETDLDLSKIFDVDQEFKGQELIKLVGKMNLETFARGARLLPLGSDRLKVLASLREGSMVLTGHQVFMGLSNGMKNTAEARKMLMNAGYDGLRYNGGQNMGMATRHNVYLAYYPRSVQIKKRFIVSKVPIQASEKQHTYQYI